MTSQDRSYTKPQEQTAAQKRVRETVAAAGVMLVIVGVIALVVNLAPRGVLDRISAAWVFFDDFLRGLWIAIVVVLVVLFVVGMHQGWFDRVQGGSPDGKLHRSTNDRRFMGVCGGIAYYFKAPSGAIRVFAVLLFLLFPPLMLVGYLFLGFALSDQ